MRNVREVLLRPSSSDAGGYAGTSEVVPQSRGRQDRPSADLSEDLDPRTEEGRVGLPEFWPTRRVKDKSIIPLSSNRLTVRSASAFSWTNNDNQH